MRVLFVIQRFGPDIAGGAEQLTREYARRLVHEGHEVEVLTSCATSYVDWANRLPAGTEIDEGVVVHRLPVTRPRDNRRFGRLHERLVGADEQGRPTAPLLHREWASAIGPDLTGLRPWLLNNHHRFDVAVFSGYMYSPTLLGLPVLGPLLPCAVISVAHDEPTLRFPAVRSALEHAVGWALLTPEEAQLVRLRLRPDGAMAEVGAGVDFVGPTTDDSRVLHDHGLTGHPYLVCAGRISQPKGMHELAGYFAEYRRRRPDSPLRLVFVGSEIEPLPRSEGIVVTGWVTDEQRWALLHGAMALAQPSYFESFSLILAEAMMAGKPSIVQGRNDVLRGQVQRGRSGLAYRSYAEFDAALELLESNPRLRDALGDNGRAYAARYRWSEVLPRFERLLVASTERWRERFREREPHSAPTAGGADDQSLGTGATWVSDHG